jgi:high-affinity iron transporter
MEAAIGSRAKATRSLPPPRRFGRAFSRTSLLVVTFAVAGFMVWHAVHSGGSPNPLAPHTGATAASLDIGVLVFREGLECILVLAAITASLVGSSASYRRPIAVGAVAGFAATLLTWGGAVRAVDALTGSVPALYVQAATGLLAIIVLLVVMNWFFHKVYWTGWISLHNRRKKDLLTTAHDGAGRTRKRVLLGFAALGFTSLYREGFEVVLFLQTYRLRLGTTPVRNGVLLGLALTAVVAALTFVAHRHLPYKKMLVVTGILLGAVLLVMVGEQAQEMQLAHWLPTTVIPGLQALIPAWMGMWFAVFPTVETLTAQLVAGLLVLGSYMLVRMQMSRAEASAAGT